MKPVKASTVVRAGVVSAFKTRLGHTIRRPTAARSLWLRSPEGHSLQRLLAGGNASAGREEIRQDRLLFEEEQRLLHP